MELWRGVSLLFECPPLQDVATPSEHHIPSGGDFVSDSCVRIFQPDLYHASVVKGKRLYNMLAGLDAPIKTLSPVQLVAWYSVKRGAKPLSFKSASAEGFKNCNVSNLDFELVIVASGLKDAAYKNWYNARQKCILYFSNYKKYDKKPVDNGIFIQATS